MSEDPYSLPPDDPCHSTLEAYKFVLGSLADRHWQAAGYQQFRQRLEAGQHCCPALREKAAALQPEITDPAAAETVTISDFLVLMASNGPCSRHFSYEGADSETTPLSQAWADQYNAGREGYWNSAYAELSAGLEACCRQRLNQCLAGARQAAPEKTVPPAAAARCNKRFAPQEAAAPAAGEITAAPAGAGEAARKLGEALSERSAPLRAQACQEQLRHLIINNTVEVLECTAADAQGQRHCTHKDVNRAENAEEFRDRFMKQSGEQREQLARLQGELQAATAVHPGREVLAAIPEGRMSGELALLGAIALLAGAVCGLPGISSPRGKLLSGAAGVLIALLVFAGVVAVLPDIRLPYLLLALAGAVLAALLWALSRALLLLRTRRPAPGQP